MEKTNNDAVSIAKSAYVKVTKMNHIVEVQHMEKINRSVHIKKLDKDTYLDIATGEIREFNHSDNRQQNYNSLRQTFKKLRYLINNNFQGKPNELHVTLTYKENMTDPKRLYDDFKRFMTRLKRKYKGSSSIDYVSVVEPQERGAWHCHVLLRFNDLDKVFLSNKVVRDLWEQGRIVSTKSLNEVDNIGAYLSAYLSDVELNDSTLLTALEENREVVTKVVDGKEKRFIKGGRLHMYPSGMNLYRKSKGIVEPERVEVRFEDVKKIVGAATPHYQKSYHVQNGEFENTITFLQYNTKRDEKKE
jgi:hypothetical protein